MKYLSLIFRDRNLYFGSVVHVSNKFPTDLNAVKQN